MLYIQELLKQIITAHETFRSRFSPIIRFGIIAFLAIMAFIILIFKAEWLMNHMIALLPLFYIAAVLAVGLKRALYGTAVFIFFSFALWLRVGPPHQGVLGGSYVMFAENDGWYNMRLIENLVHHFPFRNTFEPYTLYPTGQNIPFAPFFDWFGALFIWIAGLGHPTQALIEKMGAYYPAVLGALTVIPVYFIAKEIFNRNAGLIAAGLIAMLPGEFLFRSILGFTDHHVAEALFSTTTMMFFIMAIKRAQETRPTLSQFRPKQWDGLKKPLLLALLTGFMLGIYLLSWIGGSTFIFIIFVYFLIQYILDHMRGKSTDYLLFIGIPVFVVSLIMISPFSKFLLFGKPMYIALPICVLAVCFCSGISRVMSHLRIKLIYYPIAIVVLIFIGVGFLYLIDKSLYHSLIDQFNYLKPHATSMTIMEAQPFFGDFHVSNLIGHRAWSYFTTGLFLTPIAFLIIIYSAYKKHPIGKWLFLGWIVIILLTVVIDQKTAMPWQLYAAEGIIALLLYSFLENSSTKIILLIWSFLIVWALLTQTRFAYYSAINVVLLSSYIIWKMPGWISSVFRYTSKRWAWLACWITVIIIILIIDKRTFISLPKIIYVLEGIALAAWIGYKALLTEPKTKSVADKRKDRAAKKRGEHFEKQKELRYLKPGLICALLSVIVIFSITIYPNFIYGGTYDQHRYSDQPCYNLSNTDFCPSCAASLYLPYHPYGPNSDWYEALAWMRSVNSSTGQLNTPDPFGEDALYINGSDYPNSFYYSLYQKPASGETYDYPDSAYGVMSWWDYGHWITRIGRRLPNANPFQSGIGGTAPDGTIVPGASIFMTAQNETEASSIMDALDSRYVAIDYETAWPKYHTMIVWSGKNETDFYENWYREPNGELRWYEHPDPNREPEITLFYTAYYQSMCARLYNFGTQAVVPNNSTWVISSTWQTSKNGERYKVLTDVANDKPFATYEEAVEYIQNHPGYVIVGTHPFVSPIPLEPLNEYRLIHSSPSTVIRIGNTICYYVEIFEYTGYKK